jgi:hypothetical protein
MMIELEAKPVHDSSAPGWWIEMKEALFIVWAPRSADADRYARPHWQACWEMWTNHPTDPDEVVHGSEIGKCLQGDTLDSVLVVFDTVPDSDLGTRARRLLSGAATGLDSEGEKVGFGD